MTLYDHATITPPPTAAIVKKAVFFCCLAGISLGVTGGARGAALQAPTTPEQAVDCSWGVREPAPGYFECSVNRPGGIAGISVSREVDGERWFSVVESYPECPRSKHLAGRVDDPSSIRIVVRSCADSPEIFDHRHFRGADLVAPQYRVDQAHPPAGSVTLLMVSATPLALTPERTASFTSTTSYVRDDGVAMEVAVKFDFLVTTMPDGEVEGEGVGEIAVFAGGAETRGRFSEARLHAVANPETGAIYSFSLDAIADPDSEVADFFTTGQGCEVNHCAVGSIIEIGTVCERGSDGILYCDPIIITDDEW